MQARTLSFTVFLCLTPLLAAGQWRAAPAPLFTTWGKAVRPDQVWPEYPRPHLQRDDWYNLNGLWDLWILDSQTDQNYFTGKILVPFPVESALSGVAKKVEPHHILQYSRKFRIPASWQSKRILLHFGAVDYEAEVLVNGNKVGWHRGGYDPFYFDITGQLNSDRENLLTIIVRDSTNAGGQPVGKQHLNPSGIWYTAVSGIWQTVWLEPVPDTYIAAYRCEPDLDRSRVIVRTTIEGTGRRDIKIIARVKGEGFQAESVGRPGTPLLLNIARARPWSPEDPYLYDLELALVSDQGEHIDQVKGYFGLRKIAVSQDSSGVPRLFLNGKPLFQMGLLDQGYWPDGLYTAPSDQALVHDIETARQMGFNFLRKHVKVEPQRWYYHCDRLGMLVWQDMPSGANDSEWARKQFRFEMKNMVDALFNHPSIVMWVPFNEGWGQFDTERFVAELKSWDPTRLVNNASGWTDSGTGDVLDVHAYPGPAAPDPSKAGPQRARVLGEFGGLGLVVPGHTWEKAGWGYEVLANSDDLTRRYEDLLWHLLPLRDTAGLAAAVYTQLSDVERETNGLLTYDRQIAKIDPPTVRSINQGFLTPRPLTTALVFHKKLVVPLHTPRQDALIQFALGKEGDWQTYTRPIVLKKTTTLRTRAQWTDGKTSLERTYQFVKMKPLRSKAPRHLQPGLRVSLYRGVWEKLPLFDKLVPDTTFLLDTVALTDGLPGEKFGLVFEGWLEIPRTDTWVFRLSSDDGSSLWVAGQEILRDDGLHGMREHSAALVLRQGRHPFRLEYFQRLGGRGLKLEVLDSAGRAWTPIWWHE